MGENFGSVVCIIGNNEMMYCCCSLYVKVTSSHILHLSTFSNLVELLHAYILACGAKNEGIRNKAAF